MSSNNVLAVDFAATSGAMALAIPMTSNIARDSLKRASDFRTVEDAIFETVANAYEAYDVGVVPFIDIRLDWDLKKKDGKVTITDKGVGMCSKEGLPRFFALHTKTVRRENGLNMRGYNGTGKVACFKYARRLEVETVKDGLRNIVVLTRDELDAASEACRVPQVTFLVCDHPTTDGNGTTIRISDFIRNASFELVAARQTLLRDKIRFEMMMWMKNAEIRVNGDLIVAQEVPHAEKRVFLSDCGHFTITCYDRKEPYDPELPYVFINAGRVFVARETFGLAGHALSKRMHVTVHASEAWAQEHFYDNREAFVSESRDLTLKDTHPEAKRMKAIAEDVIRSRLDEIAAAEDEERKSARDQNKADLEKLFSKLCRTLLSAGFGSDKVKSGSDTHETTQIPVKRDASPRNQGDDGEQERNSNVSIKYDKLEPQFQYIVNGRSISINSDYPTLKAVGDDTSSDIFKLASFELVTNGLVELVTSNKLEKKYADVGLPTLAELFKERAVIEQGVRNTVARSTLAIYKVNALNLVRAVQ